MPKINVMLRLTQEDIDNAERIADLGNYQNKAQVVSDAMALLRLLSEEVYKDPGGEVLIRKSNGDLEKVRGLTRLGI